MYSVSIYGELEVITKDGVYSFESVRHLFFWGETRITIPIKSVKKAEQNIVNIEISKDRSYPCSTK